LEVYGDVGERNFDAASVAYDVHQAFGRGRAFLPVLLSTHVQDNESDE
jgi:hypothetical protein